MLFKRRHTALRALAVGVLSTFAAVVTTQAAEIQGDAAQDDSGSGASRSPWLLLPTFSSNPKLGTSVGALGGYATKFDAKSKLSIFGLSAQYTSTDSATVAAVARASFREDHHRVTFLAAGGRIENDYDDYLGTGMPLKSEDNLHALVTRYLYRLKGDWFVGGQFLLTNYQIIGQTSQDQEFLDTFGLTGFDSGGVGVAIYHDSRDVLDKPGRGWVLNLNNIAYRKSIAGDNDFDTYRLDYRSYREHGSGNVFAIRQSNQWTVDAPLSAYAPVQLRGYTMGEYLGEKMSSLEVEERFKLAERWTATLFAGVACLYGKELHCDDSANVYTSVGGGVQYVLKPALGLVANLEYAQGKDGNNAVLFRMGYAW